MKGIVWGLDRLTCGAKMDSIIQEYELYWNIKPLEIKHSLNEYRVIFENNDIWQAVVASDKARGRKCNISLVDSNIPDDFVTTIIRSCTICPPYHAISYF